MLRRTLLRSQIGKIGAVHPDAHYGGATHYDYAGPGWKATHKILPMDYVTSEPTSSGAGQSTYDRVGHVLDPEDPRHPLHVLRRHPPNMGGSDDSTVGSFIAQGEFGYVPESSKFLQVLYANYLEPFSSHRVCTHMDNWGKVPNMHHESHDYTMDYLGQTVSLSGHVTIALGAVLMEGVTCRADVNAIYIGEGCQIMENVNMIADAPSNLLEYQRNEKINPYQKSNLFEGVVQVGKNTIVEANCHLESCRIGPFNRIGHGTHIMKGTQTGTVSHILPGSVVVQNTKIGDGELWGGAPAKKIGKVSKYEWKKPFHASLLHREAVVEGNAETNHYGTQGTQRAVDCELINQTLVEYEGEVSPAVRAQVRSLMEGREPFEHTVVRTLQMWSPPGRTDYYQGGHGTGMMGGCPTPERNPFMSPNADSQTAWGPTGSLCPLWDILSGNCGRSWL